MRSDEELLLYAHELFAQVEQTLLAEGKIPEGKPEEDLKVPAICPACSGAVTFYKHSYNGHCGIHFQCNDGCEVKGIQIAE